jgi:hypothetical protein
MDKFQENKAVSIRYALSSKPCSRTLLVYLFIRLARISYGLFIAIRYKFKLSTYILEPLVIGRRGFIERFKQENGKQQITEASSPVGGHSSNSGVSEVVDSVII